MIQIAEYLPPEPTPLWTLVKQVGVNHAVGFFSHTADEADAPNGSEPPWALGPMRRMKERFEAAGLPLAVIESSPPMQKVRLGLTGRDEEIEWFCEMLRNMGELGVPVVCYNYMAVLGWTRTRTAIPDRGGALVSGFDLADLKDAGMTDAGNIPEEQLWESLKYFLKKVVPVAEKSKVKLAMHPDDPPLSPLRGIGRIMRSVDGFQRLIDLFPSEYNGLTLCQGNFALMTDDLPATIRHFGKQGLIHFVHMRDVVGTPEGYVETFHDRGPTDMLECFRAYKEIGFEGVLRPDHVPTLYGEDNDKPGYSMLGRLHAIGYLQGLREAIYGKTPISSQLPDGRRL